MLNKFVIGIIISLTVLLSGCISGSGPRGENHHIYTGDGMECWEDTVNDDATCYSLVDGSVICRWYAGGGKAKKSDIPPECYERT